MTYARGDFETLARMPSWVTSARPETLEDVAFLSGAALNHLHLVLQHDEVPQGLLRVRLALRAAEACVAFSSRPERIAELRDAIAFLQPGDSPGPAGEIYVTWRRAIERPISAKALARALPDVEAEQIEMWLDTGLGAPVARAALVLQAVLEDRPRDPTAALILADAALAQALGRNHVVPLFSLGLKRGDLRKTGEDLRLACHRGVVAALAVAMREVTDLSRSVARLREIAPKLRARGADEAIALFLTRDALAPAALTSLRSDRAARRFCDRLVDLGVVRELTGRATFRLYGV
ncbi:MAG: DUF1403 family protein [Paracoccaceae bacterium]|nr:DUF1403 family protein [Paracoccaceae bacterium]